MEGNGGFWPRAKRVERALRTRPKSFHPLPFLASSTQARFLFVEMCVVLFWRLFWPDWILFTLTHVNQSSVKGAVLSFIALL